MRRRKEPSPCRAWSWVRAAVNSALHAEEEHRPKPITAACARPVYLIGNIIVNGIIYLLYFLTILNYIISLLEFCISAISTFCIFQVGLLYRFQQFKMVLRLFILFCDSFYLWFQFDYDQCLSSIYTHRNHTSTR